MNSVQPPQIEPLVRLSALSQDGQKILEVLRRRSCSRSGSGLLWSHLVPAIHTEHIRHHAALRELVARDLLCARGERYVLTVAGQAFLLEHAAIPPVPGRGQQTEVQSPAAARRRAAPVAWSPPHLPPVRRSRG